MYRQIEKLAKHYIPPALAGTAKKGVAYFRYRSQLRQARAGYKKYQQEYQQNILFVAGLPKSGTTWLEKMLCTIDGFHSVMIPEAVNYEQNNGESHSFNFSSNTFDAFEKALVVLKLHTHGSKQNFQTLVENNLKFVVLYRDLRDVAVSYIFYVKQTAYHPAYNTYKNLDLKAALKKFGETLLPEYVAWIDSWHQYQNHQLCYVLSYEALLNDPTEALQTIITHYNISLSNKKIKTIIEKNSFRNLSGGRNNGQSNENSFYRKGGSGDWLNYFDEDLKRLYQKKMGDLY